MRWESFLKTPMNDLIQATVLGSGHKAKVAMQCGLSWTCVRVESGRMR